MKTHSFKGISLSYSNSGLPVNLKSIENEARIFKPRPQKAETEMLRSSLSLSIDSSKETFSIYRASASPDFGLPLYNCDGQQNSDLQQDKENIFAYSKKDGIAIDKEEGEVVERTRVLLPPLRSHVLNQELHANANRGNHIKSYKGRFLEGDPVKKIRQVNTHRWTPEEDNLIIRYKEERNMPWKRIASLLGGHRTWQAVQMRYLRTHKLRESPWSSKDLEYLVDSLKQDWEGRWKRVAKNLGPTFSPQKCCDQIKSICIDEQDELHFSQNGDLKKLMMVYLGLESITYDSDN